MRFPRNPTGLADRIAIAAMLIAILGIVWARIELCGTQDIEDTLAGAAPRGAVAGCTDHQEALVRSRWVAGFSQ